MQLGNIPYLKEMIDLGLTPVNGIFILGIVSIWKVFLARINKVEGHADECDKDRKKLSKEMIDLSRTVGEAKNEAENAKLEAKKATLAAASPCHMAVCPKRSNPPSASFSIGESPSPT